MNRFFKRLLLFLSPYLIFFALPTFVILQGDEITSASQVIEMQAGNKTQVLYGPAYHNAESYYKYQSTVTRNPEVLALGSSRILEFRGEYFNTPHFWNAGVGNFSLNGIYSFISALPDTTHIKVMYLALDQWTFNASYTRRRDEVSDAKPVWTNPTYITESSNYSVFIEKPIKIYKSIFTGGIPLLGLFKNSRNIKLVGLNSVLRDNGFSE